MLTEESLKTILALNPPCVEIFINAEQELAPSYLKGLRKMADSEGAKITSVHPYLSGMEPMYFFSKYPRRFEEGRKVYKSFFKAAGILGADSVVFHGDHKLNPKDYPRYFERFAVLWEDARNYGISLCQENVERCQSRDVNFFAEMRQSLPEVEYILDIKQVVRAGQNINKMVEVMAGRIRHVHLSDHNAEHSCLPPGEGVLNIEELLAGIAKTGFSGSVIVELYRENFAGIVELSVGFKHLSLILSTIS